MNSPSNFTFILRDSAREHIENVALYLGRANRQKAVAWLTDVKSTIEELMEQPNLGVSYSTPLRGLHSIRRYRIRNHRPYWIYYRAFASSNGIEVFAVLHESQDVLHHLESTVEP